MPLLIKLPDLIK